nr:RAN protein kinase [Cryptococcus depauperatus CBS 7841]
MTSSSSQAADTPRFIDDGMLELLTVIGTGAYGVVYLALDTRYGEPVYRAVKRMQRKGLDARQRHFQRREILLHSLASAHPSVVALDRVIEADDCVYVVMEYGEEGDLFSMITEARRYSGNDELVRRVFLQLIDGVAWLHALGISHRDIKPENVVCSNGGTRVRICDFGLATSQVASGEFGCGSSFYVAPECLGVWSPEEGTYPTRSGDVWSLGVILVNLVCGRNPWRMAAPSDESFNAYLTDPSFLRQILPVSDECGAILERIFTLDPGQRITLPALRKIVLSASSFFAGCSEAEVSPEVYYLEEFDTPSLQGESGPTGLSPSSSDGGSLPPTPGLPAEGACLGLQPYAMPWDLYGKNVCACQSPDVKEACPEGECLPFWV